MDALNAAIARVQQESKLLQMDQKTTKKAPRFELKAKNTEYKKIVPALKLYWEVLWPTW